MSVFFFEQFTFSFNSLSLLLLFLLFVCRGFFVSENVCNISTLNLNPSCLVKPNRPKFNSHVKKLQAESQRVFKATEASGFGDRYFRYLYYESEACEAGSGQKQRLPA